MILSKMNVDSYRNSGNSLKVWFIILYIRGLKLPCMAGVLNVLDWQVSISVSFYIYHAERRTLADVGA